MQANGQSISNNVVAIGGNRQQDNVGGTAGGGQQVRLLPSYPGLVFELRSIDGL